MTILYFAYGSNMLPERLARRCETAQVRACATLSSYQIAFAKLGRDGSGKATILPSNNPTAQVNGVVFEVAADDILRLDFIEGRDRGYQRLEDVEVHAAPQRTPLLATTYIAEPGYVDPALTPFDWYRNLVLAGAMRNELPYDYCAWLAAHSVRADDDAHRKTRREALDILAGVPDLLSVPGLRKT